MTYDIHQQQKIFAQMDAHLLVDLVPSLFFQSMMETDQLDCYPFTFLEQLRNTEQSPIHHPEGNVWIHTMMVIDEAAKVRMESRNSRAFMWAALLHDIGKPQTTKIRHGHISSYDHDKWGATFAEHFLQEFKQEPQFISQVVALVRWHMQILRINQGKKLLYIEQMMQEVDIYEVALLGLCDKLGRKNSNRIKEEQKVRTFLDYCFNFAEDTKNPVVYSEI